MTSAELHTMTGAYAVHALPPEEQREFEAHLDSCAACAQEVAELKATAARLGLAMAETPPAEMKERVLRRITEVRQEPPLEPGRPGPGGWGGWRGRARALPRLALAACLALAAALGGVAAWQHQQAVDARQQNEQAQQQNRQVAQVLAATDAKSARSQGLPGGGTGTVVVSRSQNKAAFVTAGIAEPPEGKVYQLWFDDGGRMRSAGVMPASAGSDAVLLDGAVRQASGMGITVEPDGGSPQPTTAPLALLEFPA